MRYDDCKPVILVDYYDGAYGATIRIDGQVREALIKVRKIFADLAEGKIDQISLREVEAVTMKGIEDLCLRSVPEGKESRKTLELVGGSLGHALFRWSRSPSGWQVCVELIEPLIERAKPGHQYLTAEGVDDAVVEVAYMENPD